MVLLLVIILMLRLLYTTTVVLDDNVNVGDDKVKVFVCCKQRKTNLDTAGFSLLQFPYMLYF